MKVFRARGRQTKMQMQTKTTKARSRNANRENGNRERRMRHDACMQHRGHEFSAMNALSVRLLRQASHSAAQTRTDMASTASAQTMLLEGDQGSLAERSNEAQGAMPTARGFKHNNCHFAVRSCKAVARAQNKSEFWRLREWATSDISGVA